MPKRRTDDAVHVVMTDHFIQRHRPPGDLEAPLSEQDAANHTGEVVLYYPPDLPAGRDKDLYLAVAQVIDVTTEGDILGHVSCLYGPRLP